MKKNRDQLYAQPRQQVIDFEFDENVAAVFDDMIERSVPGYRTLIALMGVIAARYSQADSQVYDLGCSLGAATLSMAQRIDQPHCRIIAVDRSAAMIAACRGNLAQLQPTTPVELIEADITDLEIKHASVVALNFTLQFIDPLQRLSLIQKIYRGLRPGGALIVSEKVAFPQPQQQTLQTTLHEIFKRANGYSELEISQKRSALEKVLIPDSIAQHQQRFTDAGFVSSTVWLQCFNFISMLALKASPLNT